MLKEFRHSVSQVWRNKKSRKRFIAGLLTLLLSAWLGFDAVGMRDSIEQLLHNASNGLSGGLMTPYFSIYGFVMVYLVWMWAFTGFVVNDSDETEEKFTTTVKKFEK